MNKTLKTVFLSVWLVSACVPALFGEFMSLYSKNLGFFLDDKTGHFYLENPNPKTRSLKELLFKDEPPTSYITVILDGKPYQLTELKTVKPFAVADNVMRGLFQLRKTSVKVEFIMTNVAGLDQNVLVCLVSYLNKEEPQLLAGARFLFDTVIGESSKKPSLYLPSGEKLEYDRLLSASTIPEFILSGFYEMDNPAFGSGLYVYPSVNELKPASLIVGNWKRLDEKEMGYTVDPLAKFRYNEFGNPDAALAVFYKDIFVKKGEELSFGAMLTTAKLPAANLKMSEAVISPLLPAVPLVVTNYITNTVDTNAGPTNVTMMITSNVNPDALRLSGQLDLLERAALLVDRLEALLGETNLSGAPVSSGGSSMESGLENAVPKNSTVNPFEKRTSPATTPANRVPVPAAGHPGTPPAAPEVYTNVIRTNIIITNTELSDQQIRELQTERDKVQKQYEDKIQSLEVYYKNLLKKQEEEFKEMSGDYEAKLAERERIKAKNARIDSLNQTILSLDKRIEVIGALLDLNLDFDSMPPEQLEKTKALIQDLETRLK